MAITWLPPLMFLEDFQGHWDSYFAAIYAAFVDDFVESQPVFRGCRLGLKRHPEYDGKSATFWHMISEGEIESERTTDLRRCERIKWPKPIIENDNDPELKIWAEPSKKGSGNRIHIWCEAEGYVVVLAQRHNYILPWTAFLVEREHQKKKYNNRWERYKDIPY